MSYLQATIHKLEAGPGMWYVRWTFSGLLLLGLAMGYNWWAFRNFATQEAMDRQVRHRRALAGPPVES